MKIKKIIPLALIMCLLMLNISNSYAGEGRNLVQEKNENVTFESIADAVDKDNLSNNDNKKIINDIKILNEIGLSSEQLESVKYNLGQFNYVFKVDNGNKYVDSEIAIDKTLEGDTTLNITEEDLNNIITLKSNGKVFVDGNEITSTMVQPRGGNYYSVDCPSIGGKASDFTYYAKSEQKNYINLEKALGSFTISGLATVLCYVGGFGLGSSFGVTIATFLVTYGDPDDEYVSAKKKIYYNKNYNKFMVSTVHGCQKEEVTYYTKQNYTGKSKSIVQYYWLAI